MCNWIIAASIISLYFFSPRVFLFSIHITGFVMAVTQHCVSWELLAAYITVKLSVYEIIVFVKFQWIAAKFT